MKILINASSSTAGGGITYLSNILNQILKSGEKKTYFLFVIQEIVKVLKGGANLVIMPIPKFFTKNYITRVLWEQVFVVFSAKKLKVDVFFSTGNSGPFFLPIKHILFSRNAIFYSRDFDRDLILRKHYFKYLLNKLKRIWSILSILRADINLVPTKAFGEHIKKECRILRNTDFKTLYHGFDRDFFTKDKDPLPEEARKKLKLDENYKRILLVSHYNYFRNFETLIKAIPDIKKGVPGEKIMVVMTTDIQKGINYGGFDATYASDLIDELNVREDIAMLGKIPYSKLHRLYEICDVSISPSYAETFGHPMVEAMAMGTPVLAANTPIHKEICRDSALYFNVFEEKDLAEKCSRILKDPGLSLSLRNKGKDRYKIFSWEKHLLELTELFDKLG